MNLNSIDLFSGLGGLSWGLKKAGFQIIVSVELDSHAVKGYKLNFPDAIVIDQDIRGIHTQNIKNYLGGKPLHLLQDAPPVRVSQPSENLTRNKVLEINGINSFWNF